MSKRFSEAEIVEVWGRRAAGELNRSIGRQLGRSGASIRALVEASGDDMVEDSTTGAVLWIVYPLVGARTVSVVETVLSSGSYSHPEVRGVTPVITNMTDAPLSDSTVNCAVPLPPAVTTL